MPILITAFYASLLAIFYIFLSLMVIKGRQENKLSLGDGGDKHMMQAVRVHGNFIEYVPFALLLMMFAEINGVHQMLLHVCGWWLIIARGLHAHGLKYHYGVSWQRLWGTLSTFLIYLVLIVANLQRLFVLI